MHNKELKEKLANKVNQEKIHFQKI